MKNLIENILYKIVPKKYRKPKFFKYECGTIKIAIHTKKVSKLIDRKIYLQYKVQIKLLDNDNIPLDILKKPEVKIIIFLIRKDSFVTRQFEINNNIQRALIHITPLDNTLHNLFHE